MGLQDACIPENKLPQCWTDDVRMNALFAPFRLKTANPESWDMKMNFWTDMLRLWCRCKKDPIVSAADSKFTFQRKGRTPACIDIVVEELYRNGDLSPVSKYQQIFHNGPEGWMKWGARLAFKPAAIALTAVTSFLPMRQATDSDGLPKASIEATQRFVMEEVVKEQATDLLLNYPPGEPRFGTVEELMRSCRWQQGREPFEILLGYLVAQGSAVKKDNIVKLAEADKKASPVTEAEAAVARLMGAEARLQGDAGRLARDAAAAEGDARAALAVGNKLAAKNHLRRKHTLQQRATRCEGALDNVRQLLAQLQHAEVDAAIVDTYRTSSKAMKQTMKDEGMEEDAVHETMDDLKEVMESYNEVEKILGGVVEDVDVAELERELAELLVTPGAPGGGAPARRERADTGPAPAAELAPTPAAVPRLPSPPAESPRKQREREFVFDGEARVLAELHDLGAHDRPAARAAAASPPPTGRKAERSGAWSPAADGAWGGGGGQLDRSLRRLADDCAARPLLQDERLHPGQQLRAELASGARLDGAQFQVRDHRAAAPGVWLFNAGDAHAAAGRAGGALRRGGGDLPRVDGDLRHVDGDLRRADGALRPGDGDVRRGGGDLSRVDGDLRHVDGDLRRVDDQRRVDGDLRRVDGDLRHVDGDLRQVDGDLRHMDNDLAASTEYFSTESPGKAGGSFQMAPGGERRAPADSDTSDLQRRLAALRGFRS